MNTITTDIETIEGKYIEQLDDSSSEPVEAEAEAETDEDEQSELVEQEVLACQQDVQARIKATNKYAADSRKRLDAILGKVLGFGQRWLKQDGWNLNDAYRRRAIDPTPIDGNHFLQLTYLLTGSDDLEKTRKYEGETVPKFNKGVTLAKYAGALRLMDEEGVTSDEVPAYIENFEIKHPGYGKRLIGMLALDRERNGTGPRDMFVNKAAQLDKAATAAIQSFDFMDTTLKDEIVAKPREFALAWGVVVDGQFYPGGQIDKSEARAKTAALKSVEAS